MSQSLIMAIDSQSLQELLPEVPFTICPSSLPTFQKTAPHPR